MRRRNLTITGMTWIVILVVWAVLTMNGRISEIIIPSPAGVWKCFVELLSEGYKGTSLWGHLASSLRRLFIAYFWAVILAIPAGLLSGTSQKLRAVIEPIIAFIRPLPPLGYYTLIILWMGIGDSSKILLLFLGGFAPIYLSCVLGVTQVKQDYIYRAQTLGASKMQIFFKVIIPSALPEIFIGLRNAMSIEYSTSVAAEMVAATSGIGWVVLDASKYLRSDVIFVGIIVMGVTGIILDTILKLIEHKVAFWEGKN